jgi:hypothetical protein
MAKDILLDENNDRRIENGDFVTGDSEMQEVSLILQSSKGHWPNDLLIGPGLTRKMRSVNGGGAVVALTKKHLSRDGKDYNAIKKKLKLRSEEN